MTTNPYQISQVKAAFRDVVRNTIDILDPDEIEEMKKYVADLFDIESGDAALKIFRENEIPINPPLPWLWDDTPNDHRPRWQQELWDRPYIVTVENDQWPEGIRYDVRRLDGGAWDRSTCRGQFGSLDEAMARCRELVC